MNNQEKFVSEYLKLVAEHKYRIEAVNDVAGLYIKGITQDPRVLVEEWELLINSWRPKPRWLEERVDNYLVKKAQEALKVAVGDAEKHTLDFEERSE